jgi:peptidoglycan/LPS O-acetylase OafA/YrhL
MKLYYRPEIDGLRALAVLSAIFYHAQISVLGFNIFQGGYIGVDIFFVISGYLITSLMLKELKVNKSFSFLNFYERRCRRILPVLFFIILASLPFAWFYLLPSNFENFSRSILSSVGFASNLFFHFSGLEYAGIAGMYKPFLHTWSLSVEEQYYIIFPILLIFIFKFFNKYLFQILAAVCVVSLLFAEWGSRNYISATFYFIHSRMWELLAGSMMAYLEIKKESRSDNQILNELLPILGMFLIIFYIISYNDEDISPSIKTLIPIIGTCLFIWFSTKETLLGKIMSFQLIVGIGLISYSLYLWHYPIFAFSRITEFTQGDLSKKLLLITFTLILSIVTYFLIETPFRDKKKIKTKLFFSIIILSLIPIITFNFLVIKNNGFESRIPKAIISATERATSEKIYHLLKQDGKPCFGRVKELCSFNSESNNKIYMVGDSHFSSFAFGLEKKLATMDYNFNPITNTGWFYFSKSVKMDENKKIDKSYLVLREKINEIVSKSENNIFIFGGVSSLYFFDKRFFHNGKFSKDVHTYYHNRDDLKFNSKKLMNEFKEQIQQISKKNKVILIYPAPELGFSLQQKLLTGKNWKKMQKNPTLITFPYENFIKVNKEVFDFYNTLDNENIYRVFPHKLFCNTKIQGQCVTHNETEVFYSDEWHVSIEGAEMINELILEKIKNISVK